MNQQQEIALASYKELVAIDSGDWLASYQLARLHFLRGEKSEARRHISNAQSAENLSDRAQLMIAIVVARVQSPPFSKGAQKLFNIAAEAKRKQHEDIWSIATRYAVIYANLEADVSQSQNSLTSEERLALLNEVVLIQTDLGLANELSMTLMTIGRIEHDEKQYEKAIHNYSEAIKVERIISRPTRLHVVLSNIAQAYYDIKDYESASLHNNEAISIMRNAGLIHDVPFNWRLSAFIAFKTGQQDQACRDINKAYRAFDKKMMPSESLIKDAQELNCTLELNR